MKLVILRGNDVTIAYTPRKCDGKRKQIIYS